ncbi:NAD(P)/FAD-dependent oxidoreductase [Cupriavidus agavae]|uniref:Glycine/D-amino acid oxidase-like deaminating enzyme n=1 Tax=Cupriavidus agavae TaxID=1001822 RepID=A0A4Q7S2E7_9BURK|nr:FAD-binding oxidoreductase [Cupriavidus agavae]RZT39112.1 glycine/D-amino acid oxidase-like deaminating enzyme [Cupriavidus agavae]
MQPIRKRPAIDGQLGWFDTSPSRHTAIGQPLQGRHQFDFAVIGAGFTGVALARRLAELHPGARIALVEALEVGQGASGRNAGFIIDIPHNVDGGEADAEANRQLHALNLSAIERLRGLRDAHGIDCDWQDAGKYMSAHETAHIGALEQFAAGLQAAGFAHEFVSGNALAERLGTDYYQAAIYTPGNVLVNPASLVRGLAAALPASVTVFRNSAVTAIRYGKPHALTFAPGTLVADTLVLTAGSFSEAFGQVRNRLATLFTYASLTEPLDDAERAHFANVRPWGSTSAHPAGTTVRYTPDGRIFVRNTFHYRPAMHASPADLRAAAASHRQSFEARFPRLARKPFAYTWGGLISMTLNHHSVFRREDENLFSVVGCNGVGVAKGTYLGHYMAEYMAGQGGAEVDYILANSRPSWIPPEPVRGLGAALRLRRELAGAGGEI